ncbi:hypothetical protein F8A10_16945 [Paracoccus kondratievae]|uniref:hypothetical protein n=1 Tax=Paracoccus kondratievae TaxID=135740 RepID=UPI001266632A|nr:hypothetical protein [Paracoccus kondratievae]QFQ89088.1 hypothetical protein F8A10_16945 [Paracoccus kondratievae]
MTAKQKSELDTDGITDQRRIDNLRNMLAHLSNYPADDAECILELKLPLSMLAMIMKRSAEARTTPQSLVLDLLSEAGY